MSGNKYVLDTNALIAFFNGNDNLQAYISQPNKLIVSVVSVFEFLSYPNIIQKDRELFFEFLDAAEVVDLIAGNKNFIDLITSIRTQFLLKLPDAIIASTALFHGAQLITNDKTLQKVENLIIITF